MEPDIPSVDTQAMVKLTGGFRIYARIYPREDPLSPVFVARWQHALRYACQLHGIFCAASEERLRAYPA